jgi:two-component system sensor histidine kinase CpxA
LAPKRRLVRLDRLLNELVNEEEIEATSKGCQLELQVEPDLTVVGDPELLHSCFENIVRNAIRYAPQGTAIEVSARRGSGNGKHSILVEISDRGPGVPQEYLSRIFEPYIRVSSGNHDPDSTGLGLAIVKRVVQKHAGEVKAARRAGGGLTISVDLPAAELS